MNKKDIDFPKIEYFISLPYDRLMKELEDKKWTLTSESVNYLKRIIELNEEEYNSDLEKYNYMLEFIGKEEVHKIARDIRENIRRQECKIENFKDELNDDIFKIRMIIERFSDND